jgi:hypothetical protein
MDDGTANYTVRVTDMANVWEERLERKRICMRAWDLNTSIDPSDTPENMAKFLASIRSALDASQSGHDQTSLTLQPGTSQDAGIGGLVLKISCEIPGLATLRWTMHLAKAPTSAVATALVLPLLQAQLARVREVEALTELVHRKDSVMTKLVDKLEATGTGLENVFNSLSTSLTGRKKISRAAAGEKIRGLAPFNEDEWQEEIRSPVDGPSNVTSLLNSVFAGRGMRCNSSMEVEETPGLDQWWHSFQSTKPVPLQSRPKQSTARATTPPPNMKEATVDDEDDFQVQSTPPGLRAHSESKHNNNGATTAVDGGSTASEDEDQSPPSSAKKSAVGKLPSRLGTIGGKRQPSKDPSPAPEPTMTHKPHAEASHDSETASEVDDDPTASLLEPSSPPVPAKAPVRKAGLGRIGGTKPKAVQEEPVARSTSPEEAPKPTPTPKKLGIIGQRAPDKGRDNTDHDSRGRSRETPKHTPEAPRETSQERADRKRDELKRELEKKAAAGPAKKKRKF